jgi:hypothetical protein
MTIDPEHLKAAEAAARVFALKAISDYVVAFPDDPDVVRFAAALNDIT